MGIANVISASDGANSVLPGYSQTELGLLPADWRVSDIGSLNPFVTSGSRGWASFYVDTGAPFIRITNLSRQRIDLDLTDLKRVALPRRASAEASRTELRDGDLLISITADIGIIGIVDPRTPKPAYMNQHIALIRFDEAHVCPRFIAYSLASERPQRLFRASMDVGAKAGMSLLTVRKIRVALPRLREQEHIAEALSNVDALIRTLEKLIAKKRAIKQASMQQLLTGKTTRLPGFNGKWSETRLGDIAHIKTGSRNNQDKAEDGQYVFFVRSDTVERIDTYSYDCEAVIVPGEGGIGSIFHYVNGKFDLHQRVYKISNFPSDVCGKFIYYMMVQWFGPHAMRNTVKATVDSLRLPTFQNFTFSVPSDVDEQRAIAAVLSDMDAEIETLKRRRNKTKQIRQGMMQQLLTGRVRLVKTQAPVVQPDAESKGTKAHSWAFNEAVVISLLAKQFGSEQFPLGRKRYTKLSYLLHRHAEKQADGYLKKAAGPYNPRTKYGGPERIAVENGYVREHASGPYRGFVAADNIAQAGGYFGKWYGDDCIQWLEQFRFKKNDDLEVLTTVDMAVEELRAAGKSVDVASVKDVICSHLEWQAKLHRPVFSDSNIGTAIETSRTLFG